MCCCTMETTYATIKLQVLPNLLPQEKVPHSIFETRLFFTARGHSEDSDHTLQGSIDATSFHCRFFCVLLVDVVVAVAH
jgi:hypothetical protein